MVRRAFLLLDSWICTYFDKSKALNSNLINCFILIPCYAIYAFMVLVFAFVELFWTWLVDEVFRHFRFTADCLLSVMQRYAKSLFPRNNWTTLTWSESKWFASKWKNTAASFAKHKCWMVYANCYVHTIRQHKATHVRFLSIKLESQFLAILSK